MKVLRQTEQKLFTKIKFKTFIMHYFRLLPKSLTFNNNIKKKHDNMVQFP